MASMAPKDQIILISGGSGFLASHIVKRFLDAGDNVRTTVRSEAAKQKVMKVQNNHSNLSFCLVPDGQVASAYDEAVKGVHGVIHTASPFTMHVQNNERDLLLPAINGISGMMKSIKANNSNIKRVIVTSSFAAMVDVAKGPRPGHTYTEADWNPITYDYAKASDMGALGYCASKKLAEKAAWDFVEQEKPNFSVTAICPPMTYGPAVPDSITDLNLLKMNTSSADIYRLINGYCKDAVPTTDFYAWVDARDVAEAHLKAYTTPEAAGQRYFCAAGRFTHQEICDIIRKEFPQLQAKCPEGNPGFRGPETYAVGNGKICKELGMTFVWLENCIKDMVGEFMAVEKRLGAKA